jgi:hypothetical protein
VGSGRKDVDIPINVIGSYTGSVAEGLGAGKYILKVDADAAWTITVSQPRHVSGTSLPQTYSGHGQLVKDRFRRVAAFALSPSIKAPPTLVSRFVATMGNPRTSLSTRLATKTGQRFPSSAADPTGWGVNADGDWTITVSNP